MKCQKTRNKSIQSQFSIIIARLEVFNDFFVHFFACTEPKTILTKNSGKKLRSGDVEMVRINKNLVLIRC